MIPKCRGGSPVFRAHREDRLLACGWLEGERAVLERMRALRRKPVKGARASFQAVADTLNAEGTLNRDGRPWSASRVHAVLHRAAAIEKAGQ